MAATPQHAARVLGLTVDATLEEVRVARRTLVLKYHPDRAGDPVRASRHMARINAAVDTLVAHIKGRPAAKPQPKPHNPQRANRRQSAKPSTGPERTAHRSTSGATKTRPSQEQAHKPKTRPAQTSGPTSVLSSSRTEDPSGADLALVRLAAASYRCVLDQISKINPEPLVDVRALAYPAG